MLNFFQMCDLLNKNKGQLAEGKYEDLQKSLEKYIVKPNTDPQKAANLAKTTTVVPEMPKSNVFSEPEKPRQTEIPNKSVDSPESQTKKQSLKDFLPSSIQRNLFLNNLSDRLEKSINPMLSNKNWPLLRFFTRVALQDPRNSNLKFVCLDYSQGKIPANKGKMMPPGHEPFKIYAVPEGGLDKLENLPQKRHYEDPDYALLMEPLDIHNLLDKTADISGHGNIEALKKEDVGSLLYHLIKPAESNPSLVDLALRAGIFENYIMSLSGITTSMDALAKEFATLATKQTGGLQTHADDFESLKYLIKTANTNGFPFFELKGNIDDPSSQVTIKSKRALGIQKDAEDRAGTLDFNRAIKKQRSMLNRLSGIDQPDEKQPEDYGKEIEDALKKQEATELSDLMELIEYWSF